ncbi:MAG: hypothetical protein QGF59_16260, partial [Pirellulaceae bacterium]|nr:hypothetical protein [Pirellulaceae bacterium]
TGLADVVDGQHDATCFLSHGETRDSARRRQVIQGRLRRWSGNQGAFPLEPGTWVAETWRHGSPQARSEPFAIAASSRITVKSQTDIELPRLWGRVIDARTKAPLPSVALSILEGTVALPAASWPESVQTSTDGRFQMALPGSDRGAILVRSPQHQPRMIPLASLERERETVIELTRGGALEVRVLRQSGRPAAGITVTALSQGARARVLVTATDKHGVARFEPIAPGRHLLMLVLGEYSFPLDSWNWLRTESSARLVDIQPRGCLSRFEWKISSNDATKINLDLGGAVKSCSLQIQPLGATAEPGMWIDKRWEQVTGGVLSIDWLPTGLYRAIATTRDLISIVDFRVESADDAPRVVFDFRGRN